jgi:cyclophilin family peptidyl-prolyl cis-trans isomerase
MNHPGAALVFLILAFAVLPDAGAAQASGATAPPPLTPAQQRALLRDPARPFWRTKAPDSVTLEVETSRGSLTIELVRAWAPAGVDRFYNLARAGYFDDSRFFRVVPGYIAQFGIAGDPAVARLWNRRRLPADSVRGSNVRGVVSFAQYTRTDRTTNVFINLRDNLSLDTLGFAPIGRVIQGMEVADSLFAGYGEMPAMAEPLGNPKRLYGESNRYLDEEFPKLDRIVRISVRSWTR